MSENPTDAGRGAVPGADGAPGVRPVGFRSPFIPPEWIAAHGLEPQRWIPDGRRPGGYPIPGSEGVCAFLRAWINEAARREAKAIVLTTFCDQVRRAAERMDDEGPPVFLFNLPATWLSPSAQALYRSELRRLSAFLCTCGGQDPSRDRLADEMRVHQALRDRWLDAVPHLAGRDYGPALAAWHERREMPLVSPSRRAEGKPVAVLGGPFSRKDMELFDRLEESGGHLVLDASEWGERTLPRRFVNRRLREDPFEELADAYFGHIPDVFRRPNTELFRWMKAETVRRGVRGVILLRHVWCDLWHAEVPRLRQALGVPMVDIDLTDDPLSSGAVTRLQAFLETLP